MISLNIPVVLACGFGAYIQISFKLDMIDTIVVVIVVVLCLGGGRCFVLVWVV